MNKKLASFALMFFILTGCSSTKLTMGQQIKQLNDSLNTIEPPVPSDVISGNDQNFERIVLHLQCLHKNANPFIPVVSGVITVTSEGNLTDGLKLTANYLTGGSSELDYTNSRKQTFGFPLTLVPLRDIPDVFFSQKLAYFSGTPEKEKAAEIVDLHKERKSIEDKVNGLILSFTVDEQKFLQPDRSRKNWEKFCKHEQWD